MPLEIERKFLLSREPVFINKPTNILLINQSYLPNPVKGTTQRIRAITSIDGSVKFIYTKKVKVSAGVQDEFEEEISFETYNKLLSGREKGLSTISKVRYVVPVGEFKFEFDLFHHPVSFWMLEIELPSLDVELDIPFWAFVEREVTKEKAFGNKSIAKGSLNGRIK